MSRRWGCQEAIETCSKATKASRLTFTRPGGGEVHWAFRGLWCISFKKRSTFLATSVASLALVIGDGLRLQSFVLICWAHDGQSGHSKRMEIDVRLPTNIGSSLPERPLYVPRNALLKGMPHCPWTWKMTSSPMRASSNASPLGRR